jgi:hypothetical protein
MKKVEQNLKLHEPKLHQTGLSLTRVLQVNGVRKHCSVFHTLLLCAQGTGFKVVHLSVYIILTILKSPIVLFQQEIKPE